ncbi:hypothetical protein CF326_g8729 [Tilletia indica]|nr:hypothetical protein CF326_g8729 [Tilletia indica]
MTNRVRPASARLPLDVSNHFCFSEADPPPPPPPLALPLPLALAWFEPALVLPPAAGVRPADGGGGGGVAFAGRPPAAAAARSPSVLESKMIFFSAAGAEVDCVDD